MASWMKAKTLKVKRQKRLAPRMYSADYIPVGKPPNQLVMRELKERNRGLAFDDEYAECLVARAKHDALGNHHPGREEVKAHMQRIQDTMPALMNVVLAKSIVQKTMLFFNSERTRFIIYEESWIDKQIRTSMAYMDRQRCLQAWTSERIRWVHISSMDSPTDGTTE